jgi:tRNA-dihydrouridine synthase B
VNLLKPLKIGTLKIPGNIFLAPLAGWSDSAFRSICIKNGAYFTYTEMISAEACSHNSLKTFNLLKKATNEYKLGFQIFTSSEKTAASCIKVINKYKPAVIDLNCGCSINKVLKTGSGAALLKNPLKIFEIIKAIKSETDVPVTVKLRSGWDSDTINYLKTSESAIRGGAELITLHPRTRSQGFTGHADLNHLKDLKSEFTVTVIGSGDLFSPQNIKNMFLKTKCDGVMIGRGAFGNPFIFKETIRYLKTGKIPARPPVKYRLKTALKQLKLMIKDKGEKLACIEMRKHICSYSKGINNSADFRNKIVHAENLKEYKEIIYSFLQKM